jgi:flagellar transcriptional activator FlhD
MDINSTATAAPEFGYAAPGAQIADEIRDLNLAYLMLAQSMIRQDRAAALYRLGIGEDVADLLLQMTSQQLVRVASRNMMLCRLRFQDEMIWSLLSDSHRPAATEHNADRIHASLLMAGRSAGAIQ